MENDDHPGNKNCTSACERPGDLVLRFAFCLHSMGIKPNREAPCALSECNIKNIFKKKEEKKEVHRRKTNQSISRPVC